MQERIAAVGFGLLFEFLGRQSQRVFNKRLDELVQHPEMLSKGATREEAPDHAIHGQLHALHLGGQKYIPRATIDALDSLHLGKGVGKVHLNTRMSKIIDPSTSNTRHLPLDSPDC